MTGQNVVVAGRTTDMWERLFQPAERWGWEFVKPVPATVSPEAANPPMAEQVYAPHDYQLREKRAKRAWIGLIGYLVLAFVIAVMVAGMVEAAVKEVPMAVELAGDIVLGLGVLLAIWNLVRTRRRFTVMKRDYTTRYNAAVERYNAAYTSWQQRVAEHDQREAQRVAAAMRWYPVQLTTRPARVDVFGGTEDGWASLLVTMGSPLLAAGSSVFLLDFTDLAVGDNLVVAARAKGHNVAVRELPRDLAELGIIADLDATEMAEMVAETMHTMNRTQFGADLRGLHTDLLTAVGERLSGPFTFAKVVAGLQVFRRVYDAGSDDTLSPDEVRKLNSYVDTVGGTDQTQNELQALEGELRGLARAERAAEEQATAGFRASWPVRGYSVIATRAKTGRHRRFVEHIVFHRTLQELHTREATGRETLIVAGADQIGLESLEAMARQARRAGVRLVFLVQHLRDDMQKLLGAAGTVTLLMQLGNGDEAANAAEFIGRGYKFELSQLTLQVGRTLTHGTASTEGGSSSVQRSRGYTYGGTSGSSTGPNGGSSSSGSSWSTTNTTTHSREQNWSQTLSQSEADSQNRGVTASRVYEFEVEPTALQGLAPTAFVLVENGVSGRRVLIGDCNPGTVLLDRVADRPRIG
ncbi:hypothetical protein H4696_009731 [Amycolatopsis lexingtonensis]|uniref:TraD/TraG TraM recognition site domain-containing protein n=1 Tax=Amycolatopsis lexingtonensis TaxID=218822 RepID=A0ABR9IHG6_9PSEU|nr:hypothetical protein [Amycolatopsis lexingtonensis]MBE1502631.1 hypothetical protein [Amycolatopsis lexingtonensis]